MAVQATKFSGFGFWNTPTVHVRYWYSRASEERETSPRSENHALFSLEHGAEASEPSREENPRASEYTESTCG